MVAGVKQSRRYRPATLATVALAAGSRSALAALLFDTPYEVNPPADGNYTVSTSGSETFGAWTADYTNGPVTVGSRTVNTTGAPASLELGLIYGTNFSLVPSSLEFTTTVPATAPAGLIQFDYTFTEAGAVSPTSPKSIFAYLLNGTQQTITDVPATSNFSFSVNPGDTFGFVLSNSYYTANNSVTITNFTAPVPEPSALMLLASGFTGVIGLRLRRRRFA